MAQIPILRRIPEGGPKHLLSLTIDHPDPATGTPPAINFDWDATWVKDRGLPPVFAQQIMMVALQALFAGGLVICSGVVAPPVTTPGGGN